MSGEQMLEAITYLSWALDFVLLGVAMAFGTVMYRRMVRRMPVPAGYRRPSGS